jgi:REP element-mobilizing transposase RayT
MAQSFASLHVHLIFSTKHRVPVIGPDWRPRLFEYIGGTLRSHKCCLVAAGGVADHVHLLVSLSRDISVSETVGLVKANSSRWVHETFADQAEFAWETGYGAFAASFSNLPAVKKYLAGQEEHHRTRTFQEEFREFLQRHQIEYDERYVWD